MRRWYGLQYKTDTTEQTAFIYGFSKPLLSTGQHSPARLYTDAAEGATCSAVVMIHMNAQTDGRAQGHATGAINKLSI